MYQVSDAFKQAIKSPIVQFDIRGIINGISFGNDDILKGSLSAPFQCSGNDEINIGSVYINELNVTLLKDIDRYSVLNKEISYEVGVKVGNTFEYVPMGVYIVSKADRTSAGLVIKAYDKMSLLDKAFTEQATGTAYEIANFACASCGVVLANEDFDDFVNHEDHLVEYPDSDIETYRDLIYWIAQTLGCFVTANRSGEIEFRKYKMSVDDTLDTEHRYQGGNFADYETWYTGVECVNMEDNTTSYYGLSQDDGLTYNLGSNPFLQYGNFEQARRNVLDAISSFEYVPFSSTIVSDPRYDLGDVLSLPDGLGDSDKKFCITRLNYKYGDSVSLASGGKNPKFANVRSKIDKELTALAKSRNKDDVIEYYSFTNTSEIEIGDGEEDFIIDIRYTALKKTVAIFLAEILCDVETTVDGITFYDAEGRFKYYLNDLYVDREPIETWQDGKHIKHILYYLVIEAGVLNRLQVKLNMTGGSTIIPMGGIRACIYGQNLVASDKFDGFLEVKDTAEAFNISSISFTNADDSVNAPVIIPLSIAPTETANPFMLSQLVFNEATENAHAERIKPNRITEDETVRVTEDEIIRKADA